eukprot:COSAG02_NODE_8903_length_2405_cov_1.346054_1_plen_64_part_00
MPTWDSCFLSKHVHPPRQASFWQYFFESQGQRIAVSAFACLIASASSIFVGKFKSTTLPFERR